MGACSSEVIVSEEPNNENEAEITELVAFMGKLQYENIDSRTSVTIGEFGSKYAELVWAEKDTLGIYPTVDNQLSFSGDQLSFPIIEGVGTSKCIFTGGGWALKNSTAYKAYSPFNRAYYYHKNDNLPISMLGQKQIGNGNSDHLGKYDLQIAQGKTPEQGKIEFNFEHQVSFIRMDLTAPKAATWKSITLKSDALFTTEASMDMSKEIPTLTSTSTANSVTLELENVATEVDEVITAYMLVLPVDFTEKQLYIILTDSDDKTFKSQAIIYNDNRNFRAGNVRWIKTDFIPNNIENPSESEESKWK